MEWLETQIKTKTARLYTHKMDGNPDPDRAGHLKRLFKPFHAVREWDEGEQIKLWSANP